MLLNENTYEEIFMLYIDNELTANERAAVEAFTQSNPRYSEALKALQDTKLTPSLHAYEDKALLYRFDSMDAQLDITFKQSLYKKETHIIQPLFNKKMWVSLSAIAALFLFLIGYTVFKNNPSNNSLKTIAKTNTIQTRKIAPPTESKSDNINDEKNIARTISVIKQMQSDQPKTIITEGPTSPMNTIALSQVAKNISSEFAANTEELNNNIENSTIVPTTNNTSLTNNKISSDSDQPTEDYTVLNTDHSDKIIYIANLEIDSEKLRGISRKVSALFKRNKIEKEK